MQKKRTKKHGLRTLWFNSTTETMAEPIINLELMQFIETNILPRYATFDKAHNMQHVTTVIRNSIKLARQLGADIDMAYTIAAYHDLGLEGPRAVHHITSGKIVAADQRLKKWFSPQQIAIMKEAVEDHRASASHAPRSVYGRIVAEADRDIQPETIIRRTIEYGISNYPELDKEGHWQRTLEHMHQKYSTQGYIKLWIPGSENEKNLNALRQIIEDEAELRAWFEKLYEEIIKSEL